MEWWKGEWGREIDRESMMILFAISLSVSLSPDAQECLSHVITLICLFIPYLRTWFWDQLSSSTSNFTPTLPSPLLYPPFPSCCLLFRAFRIPEDLNLVRASDTPLTSDRLDGTYAWRLCVRTKNLYLLHFIRIFLYYNFLVNYSRVTLKNTSLVTNNEWNWLNKLIDVKHLFSSIMYLILSSLFYSSICISFFFPIFPLMSLSSHSLSYPSLSLSLSPHPLFSLFSHPPLSLSSTFSLFFIFSRRFFTPFLSLSSLPTNMVFSK